MNPWQALWYLPRTWGTAFWAILGAVVGSFLNVCIYRVPRGESIVFPRSRCPTCHTTIRWYHNLPVISWIGLRGRCAYCGARISPRYLLVEVWTAVTLAGLFWRWSWSAPFVLLGIFLCFCIALFFIDLEWQLLPDRFTVVGIAVGLLVMPWSPLVPWWESLAGLGLGLVFPLLLIGAYYLWRHEQGMGLGDVKLMGMIGVFLGARRLVLVILLASLAGILVGLVVWIRNRSSGRFGRVVLPFGTFLCGAAWVVVFWGDAILRGYETLLMRWVVPLLWR